MLFCIVFYVSAILIFEIALTFFIAMQTDWKSVDYFEGFLYVAKIYYRYFKNQKRSIIAIFSLDINRLFFILTNC